MCWGAGTGIVHAASVSVTSYQLFLCRVKQPYFLVSTFSGSQILSLSSSMGFPEIQGKGFDKELTVPGFLIIHIISGCRSLYLFCLLQEEVSLMLAKQDTYV